MLEAYLNDHLAGASAGIRLARRCRDRDPGSSLGTYLNGVIAQVEDDRRVLEGVMERVGAGPNVVKRAIAIGAVVTGGVVNRLPVVGAGSEELALLEDLELLSLGIEGKRLLWTALAEAARSDARLEGIDFAAMEERARSQRDGLERFRVQIATRLFRPGTGAVDR